MADVKKVDFYRAKGASLPRFVYRRLAAALQSGSGGREDALTAAIQELLAGDDPDLRKFKFVLPDGLRRLLTAGESARFEAETAGRRGHAARLKMVFPHAADEFGIGEAFLGAALDLDGGPIVPKNGRFFTIGSCFARNIAEFLRANGVAADTFALAEDLNSPVSNACMLDLLRRPPGERLTMLLRWSEQLFPEMSPEQAKRVAEQHGAALAQLAIQAAQADCVVLTLGNVVDFFRGAPDPSRPLTDNTFPKFLAMPPSEDIGLRANAADRLKKLGASLRLATYGETLEAIEGCIVGIRSLTAAPLVVTLSPVPLDSTIGLTGTPLRSAIEVDCVSKSRLRSAFDEICLRHGSDPSLYYFPSFEIVRWIAPMLPIANFGYDDAASRHVSSPVLDAICGAFIHRYVRWSTGEPKESNP